MNNLQNELNELRKNNAAELSRKERGFFDYSIDADIIKALTDAAQALPERNLFVDADKINVE